MVSEISTDICTGPMDLAKRLFLCVNFSIGASDPRVDIFVVGVIAYLFYLCFGARVQLRVDIFVVGVIAYLFCGAMHHNFTIISMIFI
jgi:hypothetical protein